MMMLLTLSSIGVITTVGALLRKGTSWRLCPICVGVSGTWLWMLIAREAGWMINPSILALLLGGSVVGIAYRVGHHVPPQRDGWFKAFFILFGFLAAFALVDRTWVLAIGAGAGAAVSALVARRRSKVHGASPALIAEAERALKRCCD